MATYRVYYKGYYHDYSESSHTDVQARNELSALRRFYRQRRSELRDADLLDGAELPELASLDVNAEYRWWEGDWLRVYRGIEKVRVAPCPVCEGSGEVSETAAEELRRRLLSIQ